MRGKISAVKSVARPWQGFRTEPKYRYGLFICLFGLKSRKSNEYFELGLSTTHRLVDDCVAEEQRQQWTAFHSRLFIRCVDNNNSGKMTLTIVSL